MSSVVESIEKIGSAVESSRKQVQTRLDEFSERIEKIEAVADRPHGHPLDHGEEKGVTKLDLDHKAAFLEWVRKPADDRRKNRLSECQHEIGQKDVSIGSNVAGGYGLPKQIATQIEVRVRQLNPFRQLVDVVTCSTNDFHYLVSLGDGTSGWSSETGSRSSTGTPSLRDVAPTFGELYALPTASNWSLEDLSFNVQQWLVDDIAADWAAQEATAIISGSGTNRPTGILNTSPVLTADSSSPMRAKDALQYIGLDVPATSPTTNMSFDSLISLVGTVSEKYLQESDRVAFVMHRLTLARIRKLKASTAGSYLWEPDGQAGTPPRLLGFPVYTCDGMPTLANDAFAVLFGNWRRGYLLADRTGMSITIDPYSTPGQTRFYARRRVGGRIKNNDALKALRIAD